MMLILSLQAQCEGVSKPMTVLIAMAQGMGRRQGGGGGGVRWYQS